MRRNDVKIGGRGRAAAGGEGGGGTKPTLTRATIEVFRGYTSFWRIYSFLDDGAP